MPKFSRIYLVPFCSSKLVNFFKFSFRKKQVLSFPPLDKWNVHNSIEKVKVYDEDEIPQYKRKENRVATNSTIISKDKKINVAEQSEIL